MQNDRERSLFVHRPLAPPFTFLIGLLVLFAARELEPPVTGSGEVPTLAFASLSLVAPAALALLALRFARRRLVSGRTGPVPPRAMLRLAHVAVPLGCWLVQVPGGWSDIAPRAAGESHLADVGLLLLPLLIAELPRIVLATAAEVCIEVADSLTPGRIVAPAALPGWRELRSSIRTRMSWPLLLLMPCAMFGAGLDLLQLDRRVQMFMLGTSPGAALGALGFLLAASVLLPAWFRLAFGVVRRLPEPTGSVLRHTAAVLGFGASRVLLLPTGNRAMNAMMVGPLPIGRFLCLTDGIVNSLDSESLAGVVAHEVGHAKRGHPLLLMSLAVGLPLLLSAPVALLDIDEMDATTKALLVAGAGVAIWSVVRALAHRFEHEADATSVDALGADPCSRALMAVQRLALPAAHGVARRLFSLHPEESERWNFMRRYEGEPEFRARFAARGRTLRRAIAATLSAGLIATAAAWLVEWKFEHAIWRFHCGDFRGAQLLVATVGDDVPDRWREPWKRFRDELAAAVAMAPDAENWDTARAAIEAKAFARGAEVLRTSGPAAAAPWFALADEVRSDALCGALNDYCAATDDERREQARRVVRRLGVPPGLEPVFAGEH